MPGGGGDGQRVRRCSGDEKSQKAKDEKQQTEGNKPEKVKARGRSEVWWCWHTEPFETRRGRTRQGRQGKAINKV